MRKDKIRTARNDERESALKSAIKQARQSATPENLKAAFSALDKAVKVNLIKKNRANRLKSRLSKANGQVVVKTAKKSSKKKVAPHSSSSKKK